MRKEKKRIVVTGGYGFIGSRFIKSVYEKTNCEIINIDKLTYAADIERVPEKIRVDEKRYSFLEMDICGDFNKLLPSIQHELLTSNYVVNFAAESHVDNSIRNGKPFIRSNVEGVFNLLEYFKISPSLEKFVQISTDEVYGDMNALRGKQYSDESFPLRPSSYYSASKASADLLVMACARTFNIPYLITRSCNNFGPNQDPEKLLPKIFKCVSEGSPVPIYGDGGQSREWMHVDDNVAVIRGLTLSEAVENEIYNVGSGLHYTNLEIVKLIGGYAKKTIDYDNVKDRLGHDKSYRLDCSKLESFYGTLTLLPLEGFLKDEIRRKKGTSNRS